jgi:hypothetical protein
MPVDCGSCELLRSIARSADAEQVHQLAANISDWDALLNIAREHRVLPQLFSRLTDMGATVPPNTQARLRSEHDRNIFHNLTNAVELLAVLKAFEQEMIPAMPFKGVVLGASVYRDLTARAAGDLDLLIGYKHLARATTILLDRGYELKTEVRTDGMPTAHGHYEYHFERPADGMVLELRWRLELTQPKFRRDLGLDWVWPRRRTTLLAGAEVPDMSPEIMLLVLCMHGCTHAWSRLMWFCDIAQLLRSFPALNWKEVMHEARKNGLRRALALGVLLAHRVAGAAVPQPILQRFESDATACKLAQHFEKNLFDAPGSVPVGRVPYDLQLLDSRDRFSFFFSIDSLRPNERDRAVLPLPKPLHPLYYLIRPFRLLRDRSAR